MKVWGPLALRVTLRSLGVDLEGSGLDMKLLVEQLQLLLAEDVVTIECHLLSFEI